MLNLTALTTLCVAVETGSFSETGRRLGYTTSAVSQQMARLEKGFGTPLFTRGANGLEPTSEARALVPRARLMLHEVEAFEADARALLSPAPRLSVASFPSAGTLLSPALATLVTQIPQVDVELSEHATDSELDRAVAGEVDLVVSAEFTNVRRRLPPGLQRRPIMAENLHVLYPSRLGRVSELESLATATWIAPQNGSPGDLCLRRLCQSVGFEPSVHLRSEDYNVMCQLVASGLGVALVPDLGKVVRSGVRIHTLPPAAVQREVSVVWRTHNPNPLVQRFASILAGTAMEMRGVGELLLNVGMGASSGPAAGAAHS